MAQAICITHKYLPSSLRGHDAPSKRKSPAGASLNWIRISAFRSFKALLALRIIGTPAQRGLLMFSLITAKVGVFVSLLSIVSSSVYPSYCPNMTSSNLISDMAFNTATLASRMAFPAPFPSTRTGVSIVNRVSTCSRWF